MTRDVKIAEAVRMRQYGLSCAKIGYVLQVSESTVFRWTDASVVRRDTERQRAYRSKDPARTLVWNNNWRKRNLEILRVKKNAWRRANPDKVLAYSQKRRDSNVQVRIADALRARLNVALRGKCKPGSAVRDLGCSILVFREWIACKFQPGMTWFNYGQWHIDHVKPLAAFDLTDRSQFLQACHYTNLQPLWAVDNLRKGAKYDVELSSFALPV